MTAPSPSSLQEGDFAYVDFDEVAEPWHEFQIGTHAGGTNYVVRSPDDDEWVQELGLSTDIRGLRLGSRWVLPPGLGGHVGMPVYRFAKKPTVVETAAFLARCPDIIKAWRLEQGGPVVDPGRAPPVVPPVPTPVLPKAEDMDFKGKEWVSVFGDSVDPGVTCCSRPWRLRR